jgi:hypothetical protein
MIASPGGTSAAGAHPRDHLVGRPRPHEVDDAQRLAQAEQVGVRVHHPGDDGAPARVEPLGAWTRQRQRPARAAHERDAAVLHRHGHGQGPRRVPRVDAGVGDDEVDGSLLRRQGAEREEQQEKGSHHGPGAWCGVRRAW